MSVLCVNCQDTWRLTLALGPVKFAFYSSGHSQYNYFLNVSFMLILQTFLSLVSEIVEQNFPESRKSLKIILFPLVYFLLIQKGGSKASKV